MWYIIRHGKTFYNENNIQQGTINSYLSIEGVVQAQSIGFKLKEIEKNFNKFKFISSPLARTFHTCQIIKEVLGINSLPENEILIRNRSKGVFENLPKKIIKILFSEEYRQLKENQWNFNIKGYENYRHLFMRVMKFIEKYKNEKNLVIVSHSGVNRVLIYSLILKNKIGKSFNLKYLENLSDSEGNKLVGGLNKIEYINQNYFISWNGKIADRI